MSYLATLWDIHAHKGPIGSLVVPILIFNADLTKIPIGSSVSQIAISGASRKRPPKPNIKGGRFRRFHFRTLFESAYALSNPFPSKPSIVFSSRKLFNSQPNYSSW